MPSNNKKIDLVKVLACLNPICPKCGPVIPSHEIRRSNFEEMICPDCGNRFGVKKPRSE